MRELTEQLPPLMTGFNFGDIVDAVSAIVPPESPAFVHGDRVIKWRDATRRMNNIARNLHARGVKPGDKVAFYMRNGIEYGELTGACFLGRLTHVNLNYRYKPEEVRYIVDNSDATVVVLRPRIPRRRRANSQPARQGEGVRRGRRRPARLLRQRSMRSSPPPATAPSSASNGRRTTR